MRLEIKPKVLYIDDNCYKWTFDAKKVKAIVEHSCKGKVLNLFAGKNRLNVDEVRVDISPEFKPDYMMDAADFIKMVQTKGEKYDTIVYDPPWNERKSKEFYEGRYIGKFTKLKDGIVGLLKPNGIIISIGYEITNFGKKRGMRLTHLSVINPKGEIRPYFISIEELSDKTIA